MWRDTVVRDFVAWLADRNVGLPDDRRAGFYGLDLYSLRESIEAVLRYLDRVDPPAATRARERYACFDHFGADPQTYGAATLRGAEPCEEDVVEQLAELRRRAGELADRDGRLPGDAFFFAEQNAQLVRDAERYYHAMFRGRAESWNLRDRHMAGTLAALRGHLGAAGGDGPIVVWAHNSHLGDARATQMGDAGELNLGQLVREEHGDAAVVVGFTTHRGTVTAADDWGGPGAAHAGAPRTGGKLGGASARRGRRLVLAGCPSAGRPAAGACHRRDLPPAYRADEPLLRRRDRRAFDVIVHLDETTALEPLERTGDWERGEEPETYPSGM